MNFYEWIFFFQFLYKCVLMKSRQFVILIYVTLTCWKKLHEDHSFFMELFYTHNAKSKWLISNANWFRWNTTNVVILNIQILLHYDSNEMEVFCFQTRDKIDQHFVCLTYLLFPLLQCVHRKWINSQKGEQWSLLICSPLSLMFVLSVNYMR